MDDQTKPGSIWRDTASSLPSGAVPEMVTLPLGRFLMGADTGERGATDDERPQHEVRIDHVFALGRFAVTCSEWEAGFGSCLNIRIQAGPEWARARNPAIDISWRSATEYLDWLNAALGLADRPDAYRLPSEAEWEYACRAGTTTPYHTGASITAAHANFGHVPGVGPARQEPLFGPQPVGSYPPNAFGLFDMIGNVWEWCADVWHDSYVGAPADGSAWTVGGADTERVLRGGAWDRADTRDLRSAARNADDCWRKSSDYGFRVARTLAVR